MRFTNTLRPKHFFTWVIDRPWLSMGLLATTLVSLLFFFQGNIGIDLADEGFLWYGTWRTRLGEIPLRDFQAYDPGRYVWGAFWLRLWGHDGLMALRVSNALFQILGLTCGLLTVRRLTRSPWLLTGAGVILLPWMYPRHKLFESSIALVAVYVAVLLTEKPTLRRHCLAGLFVGLAGFMGRQHGFYTAVSFFLLIGFIWLKLSRDQFWTRYGAWVIGIFMGYLPMFCMLATIPKFWSAFVDSLLFLVRFGNTNLPLPVPTLWTIPFGQLGLWQTFQAVSIAVGFALLPIFNVASLVYLLWQKSAKLQRQSVLISATFLSLTYFHYAFSRADIPHLAQGIDPMLVGLMAVIASLVQSQFWAWGISLLASLVFITVFGIGQAMPLVAKVNSIEPYVQLQVAGDRLWVHPVTAEFVQTIEALHEQWVRSDELMLLAPHIPMLYPILRQRSPTWDLYWLFPEHPERQHAIISELEQTNTNWVLVGDIVLDGREELRFQNTHSLIWQTLTDEFEALPTNDLPANYQFLHRNSE